MKFLLLAVHLCLSALARLFGPEHSQFAYYDAFAARFSSSARQRLYEYGTPQT